MKRPLPLRALACVLVLTGLAGRGAAQLPQEDVVEVPAFAEGLCVSNLFQSHMVLQRERPIHVWGRAAPGEEVAVAFADELARATAGPEGRWRVTLPALPASATPRRLTIRGSERTLELEDVLVGDVWLLGGQSNMEFELEKVENGALEIVSARDPLLRILTVPYGEGPEPREGFARLDEWSGWFGRHFRKGDWDVCTPEVARELSAIGYVFARRLRAASGIPIGVIDASRGGTTVEAWTPRELLLELEDEAVRAKLASWDERQAVFERDAASGVAPRTDPNYPGNCYAGMLAPLAGLSIKGALFHQGYNNALEGTPGVRLYAAVLPVMIRAWREAFGDPELPFGILSLCTDGYPQTRADYLEKMLDAGVHIRATQYATFRALRAAGDENVGFASTYDLRRRWYHPQLKLPAGERIARWALATQYGFGDQLEWLPPELVAMEPRGDALLLRLDREVGDPEDGAIEGFAIAGADRRFQPADVEYLQVGEDDRGRPRYDRSRLLLTSPLVAEPLHFRYAWGRNPLANLQATGHKDLPFATQRSDDWDMGTVPLGVLDEPLEGRLTGAQRGRVLAALRAEDLRRRLAEARALLAEHGEPAAAREDG